MLKSVINEATWRAFRFVTLHLRKRNLGGGNDHDFLYLPHEFQAYTDAVEIKEYLLYLDLLVEDLDLRSEKKLFNGEDFSDWRWLSFDREIEIVPIYNEAIAVVETRPLATPEEIPNLCRLLCLDQKTGVEIENHGMGYHFHYGGVKKNQFKRYDVLLTFNKNNTDMNGQSQDDIPLYSEPHAAGKCTPIEIAIIGHNKRRPIYRECHVQMQKRGLVNFMPPSKNSTQFFPMP